MDDTDNVFLAGMFPIVLSIAGVDTWMVVIVGVIVGIYNILKIIKLVKDWNLE